jgi:hypothetical protein
VTVFEIKSFPFFFFFFFFLDLGWPGTHPPHLWMPHTSVYRHEPLMPGSVWHFHASMYCTLIIYTLLYTLISPPHLVLFLFANVNSRSIQY